MRRRARRSPVEHDVDAERRLRHAQFTGELASSCRRGRAGSARRAAARMPLPAPRRARPPAHPRESPPCAPGCDPIGTARRACRRAAVRRGRAAAASSSTSSTSRSLHGQRAALGASHAVAIPPAARGLTANTGEYIFTPAGMPSAATRPAEARSGDIARGAVAAGEEHEAIRARVRERARGRRPCRRPVVSGLAPPDGSRRPARGRPRRTTSSPIDPAAVSTRTAGCAEAIERRAPRARARPRARRRRARSPRACTAAPSLPARPAAPPMPAIGLTMRSTEHGLRRRPRRSTCAGRRAT